MQFVRQTWKDASECEPSFRITEVYSDIARLTAHTLWLETEVQEVEKDNIALGTILKIHGK